MSSFTWLDYSEHQRRRALDVISLFKCQDTRDELGLASIRDAFAECFFLGSTTSQTRARYFLFVPWLCLELEIKSVSSDKAERRLCSAEEALIGQLIGSADPDGVIGKEVGKAIKRMPSSIYWASRQAVCLRSRADGPVNRWQHHEPFPHAEANKRSRRGRIRRRNGDQRKNDP